MTEIQKHKEFKETELRGKTAVIVGASSGLGESLSNLLFDEGAKVIRLSRSIKESGNDGDKVACDIRDSKSISEAFGEVDSLSRDLDIFINCAGVELTKSLDITTQDEIHDTLSTNLEGAILTTLEAYQRMLKNGKGHIINVSSTTGLKLRENETVYAASKWGLRGFTESLRLEAAKHGIRVTGIYPGGMRTKFWDRYEDKDLTQYMDPVLVASQIVNVIKSDISIAPSELVIERGIFGK